MTVTHTPPTAAPALDGLFRSVFRNHAAGVAVITTTGPDGLPRGFTATSLISVSAEPPTLAFAVATGASSWPALAASDHLGVHLLDEGQSGLAAVFARSGADRFARADWSRGPHGVPVLAGALAWLVCRISARVPAGDHRIVVAELVTGGLGPRGGLPLLYHQGGFTGLCPDRPCPGKLRPRARAQGS